MTEPDFYDTLLIQEARDQQFAYTPVQRVVARAKALVAKVTPGLLGFDLSAWQIFVDFALAKAAGLAWVYIRALYGLLVDSKFPQHFPAAKGVMPRTAYLYYKDADDPKAQAQKLYATCLANGDPGDYMPILDLEKTGNTTLTASRIQACLEELARLFGKMPLLYSGYYIIRDDLKGDKTFLNQYGLILAAYPFSDWTDDLPEKVLNYPPAVPAPFVMWTANPDEPLAGHVVAWQFTSKAPAAQFGASGTYLDLDWCSPAFAKQVLSGTPPPIEPPPPDPASGLRCAKVLINGLKVRATPVYMANDANKVGTLTLNEIVEYLPAWAEKPNATDDWWPVKRSGKLLGYAAHTHSTLTAPGLEDVGPVTSVISTEGRNP